MITKANFATFLMLSAAATMILISIFNEPEVIIKNHRIHTRIEGAKQVVNTKETKIIRDLDLIDQFTTKIKNMENQLRLAKSSSDTVVIIQIQDTLIAHLTESGSIKDTVISSQRVVIHNLKYIVDANDTLRDISEKEFKREIKKLKRQRNISFAVNAVLTGLFIFK